MLYQLGCLDEHLLPVKGAEEEEPGEEIHVAQVRRPISSSNIFKETKEYSVKVPSQLQGDWKAIYQQMEMHIFGNNRSSIEFIILGIAGKLYNMCVLLREGSHLASIDRFTMEDPETK